jgi:large subunit ribosomal protein L54
LGGCFLSAESAKSKKNKKKGRRGAGEQDEVDEGPQVPLDQQSIDLPSNPQNSVDGALQAVAARDELTHAMRVRRRGSIKESNFLQGMK